MTNSSDKTKANIVYSLNDKFNGLAKREQNLLMFAVPTTIIVVVFLLFAEPVFKQSENLEQKILSLQSQLQLSQQSQLELLEQAKLDPNTQLKQQLAVLETNLNDLNLEFKGELKQLVSPQAMIVLLEELFEKANDLSLLSMKSIAPERLQVSSPSLSGDNADTGDSSAPQQFNIYRHGIEITFEGSFFATRDFLDKAENLSWKLYWQDLSYAVVEHPNATTQLTLFTLSTSEAFIGIY